MRTVDRAIPKTTSGSLFVRWMVAVRVVSAGERGMGYAYTIMCVSVCACVRMYVSDRVCTN